MFQVVIQNDRCKGCGLCIFICPKKILDRSDKINSKGYYSVEIKDINKVVCIGCASCAKMCPDSVISIFKDEEDKD